MKKSIIVAMASNHAIGKDNKLMWHIPEDLQRFKEITNGHHVIMGRKTYESILDILKKPLPNRTSVVITRNKDYDKVQEGGVVVSSIEEAFKVAEEAGETEAFIIGGGEIYDKTVDIVDTLYVTRLLEMIEGADTFFPAINYPDYNIRAGADGKAVVERKIFKNFPGETHDHEFMILDKKLKPVKE